MAHKSFVVTFDSSDDNINSVLSGYNRQIMEIMIIINNCNNYEEAQNRKTTIIYEYLKDKKKDIEYLIFIYGFELALIKYQERFNGINSNISILIKDLAIMIIDEIICIYEVQKDNVEKYPEYNRPQIETFSNIKRERSISFGSAESAISATSMTSSIDGSLQFCMDTREGYNTIIGNMISENSNY